MVMDLKKLVALCEDELISREYASMHYHRIKTEWDRLCQWMEEHQYTDFSEPIGFAYCDEVFGDHILTENISKKNQIRLRAVRMLISYQKDGDFEFRTPKIERIFSGGIGETMGSYLLYTRNVLSLSNKTIRNKEQYLHEFHGFLNERGLSLDDLNVDIVDGIFACFKA